MSKRGTGRPKGQRSLDGYRILSLLAIFAMAAALFTRPELQNLHMELLMLLLSVVLALIGAYGVRSGGQKSTQDTGLTGDELRRLLSDVLRGWQRQAGQGSAQDQDAAGEEKDRV
jgi:hypothetical protein